MVAHPLVPALGKAEAGDLEPGLATDPKENWRREGREKRRVPGKKFNGKVPS